MGDVTFATVATHPPQTGILGKTGEKAWMDPMTTDRLCEKVDRGDLDEVHYMLSRGVPAECISPTTGQTALMVAAERGHLNVAKELLLNGANPSALTRGAGFTALMCAATFGHAELAQLLVDHGADVNANTFTTNAISAMDLARKHGHVEVVRVLLTAGVDLPRGSTAEEVLVTTQENAARLRPDDLPRSRPDCACILS